MHCCRDARPAKLPRRFTLADPHHSQEDRMGYAGMVEEVASAAKSRVHLLGPPDDVDDLAKAPASACYLCCLMPRRAPQVTRPSSGRSLTLYETLTLIKSSSTSTQKKHQTASLLAPSWLPKTNRKSCVGTPPGPALGSTP